MRMQTERSSPQQRTDAFAPQIEPHRHAASMPPRAVPLSIPRTSTISENTRIDGCVGCTAMGAECRDLCRGATRPCHTQCMTRLHDKESALHCARETLRTLPVGSTCCRLDGITILQRWQHMPVGHSSCYSQPAPPPPIVVWCSRCYARADVRRSVAAATARQSCTVYTSE